MGNYATVATVTDAAGGATRLLHFADPGRTSVIDDALVERAITVAEGMINTYVRKKFQTPLSDPVPQIFQDYTAEQAVYQLKVWNHGLDDQDVVLLEARVKWLTAFAKGLVDAGINPTPAKSPLNSPTVSARPTSKAVGRVKLEGFS